MEGINLSRNSEKTKKKKKKTYEWEGEGLQNQYLVDELREEDGPEGNGGARREMAIT